MIRKTRVKGTWLAATVLAVGSLFATSLPAYAETGVTGSEIKLDLDAGGFGEVAVHNFIGRVVAG